jgi:hypothetical protein
MPTTEERLRQVSLKVERAKKHLRDLDEAIDQFLGTSPYGVGHRRDPETRRLVYFVRNVEPTPDCLPLLAGDAVQNLMGALDHLAYQMVCCDTRDQPPKPNGIYFPIADNAEKYRKEKRGKMLGALQETLDAIDALKPYKEGNEELWALHRLNNIEKHRLLITVGSLFRSVDVGALIGRQFLDLASSDPDHPLYGRASFPFPEAFLRPADVLFPLKAGDELLIDAPDAKPNPDMRFRFDVGIFEPQVLKAQSMREKLQELATVVEGVVSTLAPRQFP